MNQINFSFAEGAQLAVLAGFVQAVAERMPGNLAFQGGSALHLIHGSPRFSEDLDFLVKHSLDKGLLETALEGGRQRLADYLLLHTPDTCVDLVAKPDRRPMLFEYRIREGSRDDGPVRLRLKVEFWPVPKALLDRYKAPQRRFIAGIVQPLVPTAELVEIWLDKVHAMAFRPRLKPRDVFDLWWIEAGREVRELSVAERLTRFANHARMYDTARLPETPTLLRARAQDLADPATMARVGSDLLRWLPKEHAQLARAPDLDTMVATARGSLEAAADVLAGQPELLARLAAEGCEKGPRETVETVETPPRRPARGAAPGR
jgi:predicted nucleotidyltransferase component of viral defense system